MPINHTGDTGAFDDVGAKAVDIHQEIVTELSVNNTILSQQTPGGTNRCHMYLARIVTGTRMAETLLWSDKGHGMLSNHHFPQLFACIGVHPRRQIDCQNGLT